MKIVAISDLHGTLPTNLPEGDVLCICGDTIPLAYQDSDITSMSWFCLTFLPWVDNLPYKKVFLIAGNHDWFLYHASANGFATAKETMKRLLVGNELSKEKKLIYLHDNSYTYNGVKFYGTPWVEDLYNWAFYIGFNFSDKKYEEIPKNIDVLLTHMPPKILDMGKCENGQDFGSESLRDAIAKRNIKYALCGHVHSGNHEMQEWEGTKFCNVSLKNEHYQVAYEATVFEL